MSVTATVVAGVATAVLGGWLVFYINSWLNRRSEFRDLKQKINDVAGKRATVIYDGRPYTIESFDKRGIVLRSRKQYVFLPTRSVLENALIVPTEQYDDAKRDEQLEEFERMRDNVRKLFDDMIEEALPKMFGVIKEEFIDELLDEGTEINAVIGLRVRRALDHEGLKIELADDPKAAHKPAGQQHRLPPKSS